MSIGVRGNLRLAKLMWKQGWSMRDMADALGISYEGVRKYIERHREHFPRRDSHEQDD